MKKLIFIIVAFPLVVSAYSQEVAAPDSSEIRSARDLQKNSVHAELVPFFFLSAFYERTIPTGNRSALIAGAGFTQGLWENTQD